LIVKLAMPENPSTLPTFPSPPPPPVAEDYDAICATVMGSARGRWFLDEYMRRNRNVDTSLVLAGIERIEAAIRDDGSVSAPHGLRASLLEMAKAIVDTRAEVAEIKPEPGAPGKAAADDMPPAPANSGILAAAERIQDVAWTMRERGIDPQTCEQIEALAASILSASSLRDPGDHRAHKLSEVLEYLERRIAAMLAACGEGEQASSQATPAAQAAPDAGAIAPAATNAAEAETVQEAPQPASPIDATHEVLVDDQAAMLAACGEGEQASSQAMPAAQAAPDAG